MIRGLCRIQATKGGPASLGLVDEKTARLIPGVDLSGLIANVTDLTELRAALAELATDGETFPLSLLEQGQCTGWPRLIVPVDLIHDESSRPVIKKINDRVKWTTY